MSAATNVGITLSEVLSYHAIYTIRHTGVHSYWGGDFRTALKAKIYILHAPVTIHNTFRPVAFVARTQFTRVGVLSGTWRLWYSN